MGKYKPAHVANLPNGLTGGAVGFVSYDCVQYFEPKTAPFINKQKNVHDIPESVWMFVDSVVIFDHVKHIIKIVGYMRLDETADLEVAYRNAKIRIGVLESRLHSVISSESLGKVVTREMIDDAVLPIPAFDWEANSNTNKEEYMNFVGELKKNIVLGNIIQAVPSHRVANPLPAYVSSFDLYRQLRMVNPSPYMFYVEVGEDTQIVGASPEMLVKVDAERKVYTHPIAGTRKRGKNIKEDEELALELLADVKERAEHIMLVDLGRNDVGRVSKPGSVKVDALMVIEKYSHVQHIVSKVSGVLEDDKTVYDAFRAIFPAGTVSGAPKVKAIELIATLEPEKRHIYAGAVGYVSFDGILDTAIAIRTIAVHKRVAYLQAGAGIVYDSVPLSEYEETVSKMMGVKRAVDSAIEGRRDNVLDQTK
jgi:anthranilate synthase component 1